MNFVSTGVKEVTRRVRRQKNRHALASTRRLADRAEIELGRHAWRTLANDETIRPHYATLQALNGETAFAQARIAELESKLHEQEKEREAARKEHKATLQQIEKERQPINESLHHLQIRLAEQTKALHDHNIKHAALETELAALNKSDQRLLSARFPTSRHEERLRHSAQRHASIAEQMVALNESRPVLVEQMTSTEEEIKKVRADLLALDHRAQAARTSLATRERAATVAIAGFTKQIALTRRQATRIEEHKEEPFLYLGRRIAELGVAPEEAQVQFAQAYRRRQNYERLAALDSAWLRESNEANKQDLRVFNFVAVTMAVLVAGTLLLILRTPSKREWLPRNSETILSLNVSHLANTEFARTLESQDAGAWQELWAGLARKVEETQEIDVHSQVSRITRALAPVVEGGPLMDYLLVEMRPSVQMESFMENLKKKEKSFRKREVNGLPIYEKPDVALAQVGPSTLAVGSSASVERLIRVRLGLDLEEELKGNPQLFAAWQRLNDDGAFRLITQRPTSLLHLTNLLLDPQLLADCAAFGMTLDLREPVSTVFFMDATDLPAAERIIKKLQDSPEQVLQLRSSGSELFVGKPSVHIHDQQVEWRFKMTKTAAREFLQRVSRLGLADSSESVARAESKSK
jgi:predicted  nucleic acid-binding Zn-ribbon protein